MAQNKRKKVLFFLSSNTGGAERMTVTIAKMLSHENFEVKFVIVHKNLGTIVNFIPPTYEIIHIPVHNIYMFATFRIVNVVRKEKPDILFSSLNYLNARIILAGKITKTKVIVRNNIDLHNAKLKNRLLAEWSYGFADIVVAQQEEMRQEIIAKVHHIKAEKVVTLLNPIDTDYIDGLSSVPSPYPQGKAIKKYVCAARFDLAKGQDVLVRAFKSVHSWNPHTHLYLVGSYNLEKKFDSSVRDYIIQHNLQDAISMVGFDSNPYKWVKNADCYVMPSRKEGLPNSLVEALYLGIPAVATKCVPVISRIVQDGVDGYIVPVDDEEALSKAMVQALGLPPVKSAYHPAKIEDVVKIFNKA